MDALDGADVVVFDDADQWESWLADNHAAGKAVWLKIAKKGSGATTVTNDEALDIGLCYGWINGKRRSLDDAYYLQSYMPRRPKSLWSKVNIDKVEALIASGRMREPGYAEINAAKADGRWDAAYESQKNATVPPDLEAALVKSPVAGEFFGSLNKTDRYLVILQLLQARTADNRATRLDRLMTQLEARQKPR